MDIHIQKIMYNTPQSSIEQIQKSMKDVESKWSELKNLITSRYEKERSEQKQI